MKINPIRSRSV